MNSGAGDTTQLVPGFPIRTPWDHSSVDSSPRPIAASHVLHRLLVPRHPPSALSNLTTKMLASTVQFSTNNHPTPPPHNFAFTKQRRRPVLRQVRATIQNNHTEQNPGLVLSGPNRVFTPESSRIHHSFPRPKGLYSPSEPLPEPTRQCLRR